MATLIVSQDLQTKLEELAAEKEISVEEAISGLLDFYNYEREADSGSTLTQEQIDGLLEAYEEYEKPGAVWYTLEEVDAEINARLDEHEAQQKKAS
jgi:hypothetical protein